MSGKKIIIGIFCLFFFLFLNPKEVKAAQVGTDFEYEEIQDVINDVFKAKETINFEEYVMNFVQGKEQFSINRIIKDIKDGITREVKANIGILSSLVSIAIIAAIFTNFSFAFSNNQVAETAFYIAYLLMFSILTTSFIAASSIAINVLEHVLDFMKALIPTYFLAVAFTSSAGTSTVFYQATLILITFVDMILIKLVIPLINIYLILSMANNISKEDLLSKLKSLIGLVIQWTLKSSLAAVVGFHAIQGLILPVADRVKRSVLLKTASLIPGVGDVFGSITESVVGAGILLKNAIGVAGVVVIIIVCAVPILKLVITALIYRVGSAVIQPISDKRILNCVTSSAESIGMLLHTVVVGAVLFLLTITIVAVSTTR